MAQNYMFFLKVPLFLRGHFRKICCFLKDTPSLLGWLISESPFAHHGFFDYAPFGGVSVRNFLMPALLIITPLLKYSYFK